MKPTFLLLKQGFKSMFKFKIQFLVVILLTFLASFYLASSTSLTNRMNQAYNQVVGDYETFDSTYFKKANEAEILDTNATIMPILDFVPSQTNLFQYRNAENDSFNLVFNNFGLNNVKGYEDTFITKAFFQANGQPTTSFAKIWTQDDNFGMREIWRDLSAFEKFNPDGPKTEQYLGTTFKFSYQENLNNFTKSPYTERTQNYIYQIVKMLSVELEKELKTELPLTSTTNSLAYKYWLSLPENEKKFDALKQENYNWDEYKQAISANGQFQVYAYGALESVAYHMYGQIIGFVQKSFTATRTSERMTNWQWVGKDNEEKVLNFLKAFNEEAERTKQVKMFEWGTWGPEKETIDWNMELTYEYMFGTTLWEKPPINPAYIVDASNTQIIDLYPIKFRDDSIDNYTQLNTRVNGLRGTVNPINIARNEQNNQIISSVTAGTTFSAFERTNVGSKVMKKNNGKYHDYKFDQTTNESMYEWNNIYANDIFHQKMAAKVNDLDIFIREEAFLYDRVSKVNFRFVIIDEEYDYNFKIMAGLPVMHSNEVVISQQFAFKNGYKIGDRLKIGNETFIIAGFGSDALTYYPLSDPEIPLTDPKNSVIIYAPKYVVNNIMDKGSRTDVVFSTYYFINDAAEQPETYQNRLAKYDAYQMYNKQRLSKDYDYFDDDLISIEDKQKSLNIKNFEDTYFILNWELQPKIIQIVNIIALISSIVVILMAFFAIMFAIKKNIDHNSSQIGYLKAMGVSAYRLSFSYIAYSIIITLFVIPLAWVSAGIFQEVISKVFSTYFATTLYQFVFSWKVLGILLLVFGIGALVVSYLIALVLTSKNVLDVINKENKKRRDFALKLNLIKSNVIKFKFRFPFKIAMRGFNQIIMISFAGLIVSLTVTIGVSVPSMLRIYIRDAGKYFEYENNYIMDDLLTGVPTAKKSLTASRGYLATQDLHQQPKTLLGTNPKNRVTDIYFDNNKYYNDLSWDSSVLPIIMFGNAWANDNTGTWKTDFNWSDKVIMDTNINDTTRAEVETSKLLKLLTPMAGQVGNINAVTLSGGGFEKVASYAWNTDTMTTSGLSYYNAGQSNEEVWTNKRDAFLSNTEFFSSAMSLIFSLIKDGGLELPVEIERPEESSSWKEQLIYLASAFLPNTGQQYLKDSPNRATQFTIGLNTENYTPGVESLSTEVKAFVDKKDSRQQINLTGLKNNQHVYRLNDDQKKQVFIQDSKAISQLNALFTEKENYDQGDIISNEHVIYDAQSKVLNVPVVSNLKNYSKLNLRNSLGIDAFQSKVLKIGDVVIPTNAWIYDNREITQNYNKIDKNNQLQMQKKAWINPTTIDPNKYTYSRQFDYERNAENNSGEIIGKSTDSKWFINPYMQEESNNLADLQYEMRPYYHYNNLKLFIPRVNDIDMDGLLNGQNAATSRTTKYAANDWRANKFIWHGTVKSTEVPDQVKQAWGAQYDNAEWEWIAPYNANYSKYRVEMNEPSFIENIIQDVYKIHTWAGDKIVSTGSSDSVAVSTIQAKPDFLNKVNLQVVGNINTYNGDFIIADQDLLNLLTNKSTEKYIPIDYDYYGDPIDEIKDGKLVVGDHEVTINKMKTPLELLTEMRTTKNFFMKDELISKYNLTDQEAFEMVLQNRDFNSKYSGFSEPYGVTLGMKAYAKETPGIWAIEDSKRVLAESLNVTYNGIDLVGTKLGMIISISESILLVSIFLISGIIVIAMLIIIIIADVYIMKYHKFIITMKALGYGNGSIIVNSVLIPAVIANILVVAGYFIGHYLLGLGLGFVQTIGIYIPLVVHPWVPLLIITGIFVIFGVAYVLSLRKPLTDKLTILT